jgi:hypothetical protein
LVFSKANFQPATKERLAQQDMLAFVPPLQTAEAQVLAAL